jgi:hypothetical protein
MTQDPLKYLRTQVSAAEASLKRARNNMRAEAERLKLSTSGIFAESEFVSRTTAERWVNDAKSSAQAEIIKAVEKASLAVARSSASEQRESPRLVAAKIIAAGKKARGES